MGTAAFVQIGLQAIQGLMGAAAAQTEADAASELADRQVAELERQKEEEALNARSKRSDRAREADRAFGSLLAAMADNGGAGTGNASRFAGEIGFMAGVDTARITGNSLSRVASLTSKQSAARARAANAQTKAQGQAFASILGAAGGITGTIAREREQQRQQRKQKQTATSNV